ncbi:DUF4190 domain-containing protein [Saccharopolyspora elongata]|uniref:DUF4352 domain-containing protein n=1 Tax=Saccharopolyspora elongata TaxID=2530387 RepID=A0A4R4Y636_9PSEU|nr:DUF4190 domain-containing protein [Saccharopolyspora elongata]TDD39878.1 DUF4352 domain-containing protein [Saccharopolyspora elongata]
MSVPLYPPAPMRPSTKFGGLAWAALILGIVGICGSPLPILNNLTALAAFVGLILGIIALFGTKKTVAGIGSGLCVVAIVITVVLQGIMVRELDKALDDAEISTEPPSLGIDADAPASDQVVRLNFGDQHTWNDGPTISLSAPTAYTESNMFLQPQAGKRYIQFDVTVGNNGIADYNVGSTTITAQHNGRVAQQNYMAGDGFAHGQVPPNGNVTYTVVFEIGQEPGELQVSVQPTMFTSETAYFTGQI